MFDYARIHPECHDQVMDRLRYPADEAVLYAAADACGRDARMTVGFTAIPDGLPLTNALDAYLASNVESLAAHDDLLGAPIATSVDVPFGAQLISWSWAYEGTAPASYFALYVLPAAVLLWELTFTCPALAAAEYEAIFQTMASSFRAEQPDPD